MSIKLLNGIAAVLMFVALVIGCKTNVSSTSEKFSVTFGVEGENGTLKAMVDSTEIHSGDKVEKGKIVTFTVKADTGYVADKWTVVLSEALQTGGKEGSETATVKVTFKPSDKTYVVIGINFTMKIIEAVTNGNVGHRDYSNNKPHPISLSAYRIGETEVTQKLWQAVMGNNPSFFDNTGKKNYSGVFYDTSLASGEAQGKRPVENVSWFN